MSLRQAPRRLAGQSTWTCTPCRRAFSTPCARRQETSITGSFTDILQNTRQSSPRRSNIFRPNRPTLAQALPENNGAPNVPAPSSTSGWDTASSFVQQSTAERQRLQHEEVQADIQRMYSRKDLDVQMTRKWGAGEVYAPFDLSAVEMKKWKTSKRKSVPKKYDVIDELKINPKDHWKNISMMTEYVTPMGRLKKGAETGLRPLNQRKMQRAVRRAIGGGLILPTTYHHPELLRQQEDYNARRGV